MAHKRRRRHRSHKPSIFEEFRFEITVVILFALGIFLLVEKMEIKAFMYDLIRRGILSTADFVSNAANDIFELIKEVETSDIVGILLILIATGMILLRLRYRIIKRKAELYQCPQCGGDLRRVHRKFWHRILGLILWAEVKHFSCKKCSFTGIRLGEGL